MIIKKKIFTKQLGLREKIIVSVSFLLSVLIICLALADDAGGYGEKLTIKDTWGIWLAFIGIQAWIQNKIWSERFQLTFRYPYIKPVIIRPAAYVLLFAGMIFIAFMTYMALRGNNERNNQEKRKIEKLETLIVPKLKQPIDFKNEPEILSSDLIEMQNGSVETFISDGKGKSEGLKFSVEYPKTYMSVDGDRPHIVKKFKKNECQISITVMNLGYIPDKEEKKYALSRQGRIETLPQNVELLDFVGGLIIDGEDCSFVEYYGKRETNIGKDVITLQAFSRLYQILYDKYLIQIQFAVGSGTSSKENLEKEFSSHKSFFSCVMSSFIIISKWDIN